VRKIVTLAMSPKPAPAAARTRPMFVKTWRAWATTSPIPTTVPLSSTATQPETKRRSPTRTASV
jgi:hypothetical protein